MGKVRLVVLSVGLAIAPLAPTAPAVAAVLGTTCSVFPTNNVWRADVSRLPVHARSSAWISARGGTGRLLHPDFGPSGEAMPYGIPYTVVDGTHAKVSVDFEYADESDPGPYPLGDDTLIEGGSDRHALVIDKSTCTLYETFATEETSSGWTAGSGAIFDLGHNALRPAGWTSADAAGLPILPGLVRLDEVKAGSINHAIRVTASQTDRSYVWPARHQAGARSDPTLPPMGARFRMKASFSIAGYRPDTQVILRAFKRHGMILADNGSNWYFQGTAEPGWPEDLLDELKSIPAGAFEAIDESSIMAYPDSGRVRTKIRFTRIVFDPAGSDLPGEQVLLTNHGTNPTSLRGWTVRDASGARYTFGSYTLRVGGTVVLHTGRGTNTTTHLYWGRTSAVWNNDGDKATLRDSAGVLMDTCSYSGAGSTATC